MGTTEVSIKVTVDDLLAAVAQLSDEALNDFARRVLRLQEQRKQGAYTLEEIQISAAEAIRGADQSLGDLQGYDLSHEKPTLVPLPRPHWWIPYRFSDGTLLAIMRVDAITGAVLLSSEEQASLWQQIEQRKRR